MASQNGRPSRISGALKEQQFTYTTQFIHTWQIFTKKLVFLEIPDRRNMKQKQLVIITYMYTHQEHLFIKLTTPTNTMPIYLATLIQTLHSSLLMNIFTSRVYYLDSIPKITFCNICTIINS